MLSWLGGSRIIELKTVQILDELKIPRPCIDVANVGYNVEWSQELRLEQSLREYVGAAMFLEILKASQAAWAKAFPGDTVFDMSVGYNLEGIRSPRVRAWIESMKDADGRSIDELRADLTGELGALSRSAVSHAHQRHPQPLHVPRLSGRRNRRHRQLSCWRRWTARLHQAESHAAGQGRSGAPAARRAGLPRDPAAPPAFENDLQFDEAMELIPRLQRLARSRGKQPLGEVQQHAGGEESQARSSATK